MAIIRECGKRLSVVFRAFSRLALPVVHNISPSKEYNESKIRDTIATARGIFVDAALLILDEPTAALEPLTEYEPLQRQMRYLKIKGPASIRKFGMPKLSKI